MTTDTLHSTRPRGRARGFTLVEVLVSIGIFLIMGAALVTLWRLGLGMWGRGERRRKAYEQAQGALAQISLDLEAVYAREPVRQGVPTARFICTRDKATGQQRLSFVRTFETGPERAYTYHAAGSGEAYTDGFTGDGTSLGAIGGVLGVTYSRQGRELRRATLGPPASASSSPFSTTGSQAGEVMAANCLYLGFRFWSQYTTTWNEPTGASTPRRVRPWPETVWDSTRGAGVVDTVDPSGRDRLFSLARGPLSFAEPFDDVFPEIVEVTLVVEPDEKMTLRTDLTAWASASSTKIDVASTRGFADPSEGPVFLLVGDEWVEVSAKRERSFLLSGRGLRGTKAVEHEKWTTVRQGTTFVMRVSVPGYRTDWSTEADFRRRVGQ
ncbi:MAG: PulJ/GspJ family protein [Planctomycetota bacterium]